MELLLFIVSLQNQSTEIVTGQDTIINSSRIYSCPERQFLQCKRQALVLLVVLTEDRMCFHRMYILTRSKM